jgi:hypothetical protein
MAVQTIIKSGPAKKESLEIFAVKLVNKIIEAANQVAIERYIAVAVKALSYQKVNGYIIQRFIDRVTGYLASYQPIGEQQQENLREAKERLFQFRKAVAVPAKT